MNQSTKNSSAQITKALNGLKVDFSNIGDFLSKINSYRQGGGRGYQPDEWRRKIIQDYNPVDVACYFINNWKDRFGQEIRVYRKDAQHIDNRVHAAFMTLPYRLDDVEFFADRVIEIAEAENDAPYHEEGVLELAHQAKESVSNIKKSFIETGLWVSGVNGIIQHHVATEKGCKSLVHLFREFDRVYGTHVMNEIAGDVISSYSAKQHHTPDWFDDKIKGVVRSAIADIKENYADGADVFDNMMSNAVKEELKKSSKKVLKRLAEKDFSGLEI